MPESTPARSDRAAIALAEKLLALLGEGRFTATYKYAVLLGLMDLCMEKTARTGAPPSVVTTRELAEKVVELYWPHATQYHGLQVPGVLLQNASHRVSQAEILTLIEQFRSRSEVATLSSLHAARHRSPAAFERLVRNVEWKLIEMPLPRLQTIGGRESPFLYRIAWTRSIEGQRRQVRDYQEHLPSGFDNRILLVDGVAEQLCQLNSLLRPLIQQQWAEKVARINGFEDARLKEFLFGASRTSLAAVRDPLLEIQEGRCFYCVEGLHTARGQPEVDHFIPWSRYADNGLENLVVAHRRCNAAKRDFLASAEHVRRWVQRGNRFERHLEQIATDLECEVGRARTLGVTRAIYLRLPDDSLLWQRGQELVPADPELLRRCLLAS